MVSNALDGAISTLNRISMPRPAKLAISIARKMSALIFLVPEDIVDVRPRLVSVAAFIAYDLDGINCSNFSLIDLDLRRELDEHCSVNRHLQLFSVSSQVSAAGGTD